MSASAAATLRELLRPASSVDGIDRKALAGLLIGLAQHMKPGVGKDAADVPRFDPRLEELRRIVLGREIEELARLCGTIDDPEQLAAAVGRVLPSAVAHATADERLGTVLAPAVERATQSSIRNNPRTLIDILYPVIVPAIRKSIREAIDDTFQSLNESLKASLTFRGLKWRWEGWRTGTPFAEVVLKHTVVYQIEHVFLIHHHTGLLISHVAAENAAGQDPQLVSSMLVAIQDFVRDSFTADGQKGRDGQGLDALRLGELTLWSERGPQATLVAVIRGTPPEGLRENLRAILSRIHNDRRQMLEMFSGDTAGLGDVSAHLTEAAALRQQSAKSRHGFPWLVAAAALILFGLFVGGGVRWWQSERQQAEEQQLWAGAVARLRTQPGIVVTETAWKPGKFIISGLRDPLAADPAQVLEQAGIDPSRLVSRFVPYQALDPEFVLKRLQATLAPPATVTIGISGDRISATGVASSQWLDRARNAARLMPAGGPALDVAAVENADERAIAAWREAARSLRDSIQSQEIHFNVNEPLPAPGQDAKLDQLARDLKELAELSASMRVPARVTLTGHSDDTGRGTFNLPLSLSRAATVVTLLKRRGVNPDLLAVRGAGPLEPLTEGTTEAARATNRRVSFTVGTE